jgi:hypothetical protein
MTDMLGHYRFYVSVEDNTSHKMLPTRYEGYGASPRELIREEDGSLYIQTLSLVYHSKADRTPQWVNAGKLSEVQICEIEDTYPPESQEKYRRVFNAESPYHFDKL